MKRFENKVAIITGGTSGMGLVTAKLLLGEGAKVLITGRTQPKMDALDNDLSGNYKLLLADASSLKDNKRVVNTAVATFGKIDFLFLNAGIFEALPIGHLDETSFDRIYNINVKGPLFLVNEAVPHLNDGASILFNTSVSGVKGMPGVSIYGSSKAALRSMVRTLAAELAERNIRVNAVSPGPIETPLWEKTNLSEEQIEGFASGVSQQVPLGRFGKAEEVANTALFLLSDESSYITGSELAVDGGMAQV
ncbi:glucose 1-dehydrogenase [Sungkyunkwania multivorans]|uniref:Glucose 1-dehydrogenase n=1 Tax=Sungkyunkwania multivorans TaxID=1173618 RepID=A0ABW3CZ67_9FLAO